MNTKNKIIVVGGGKHTKVCIEVLKQMNLYEIAGVIYINQSPGEFVMGVPVLGPLDILESVYENVAANAIVGIGGLSDPAERSRIFNSLTSIGFTIPNLIHPKSIIEESACLGNGNQVMAGTYIGSCCVIGDNCIINVNTTVSHDCVIGDHVHITPGAVLAGSVNIGDFSFVGMNVTIAQGITVSQHVVINNGCNISGNIPGHSVIHA